MFEYVQEIYMSVQGCVCSGNMFICSGDMFVQGMFVQEVCLSMYREYFCLFGDVFVQGMCLSFSDIYLSVQGMLFRRYV